MIRGVPLAADWPDHVQFHMDPNFPKAVQLADWIQNLPNGLVASARLKAFIEAQHPLGVEYLPIEIIDCKGKVASRDYFLLNPSLQDALDLSNSVVDWNPIDPDLICSCTTMVFDASRIDPRATLFRLKHYPSKIVFHRRLAEAIKNAGFTGIKFIELEDVEY
ncbi:MAG: hypothetical protein RLZZ618_2796 [Pseudomonadota bacterium]